MARLTAVFVSVTLQMVLFTIPIAGVGGYSAFVSRFTGFDTERIAFSYMPLGYGHSFTISVQFTDGLAHRVAIYLLDWDTRTRTETVTLTDQKTGAVIDSKTFSDFSSGEYAVWQLSGSFNIQVTADGSGTPVLSRIFSGANGPYSTPPTPGSSAGFVSSVQWNALWGGL